MKFSFVLISIVVMVSACAKKEKANAQENSVTTQYLEDKEDFRNPERGFYMYTHTKASNFTALSTNQLNLWKSPTQASGGNYTVNSTLLFRYYELDIFKEKGIDPRISNFPAG